MFFLVGKPHPHLDRKLFFFFFFFFSPLYSEGERVSVVNQRSCFDIESVFGKYGSGPIRGCLWLVERGVFFLGAGPVMPGNYFTGYI